MEPIRERQHWLMKAEPESRIVKGIDVKFSAQDFEAAGTTSWEGVRNHQAKNFLKEKIQIGDQILFYASNTKVPGITALASCTRAGYPDHNAWDPAHPYHDPKSSADSPTWFMVDLLFGQHLPHPVSLRLLQFLSTATDVPECLKHRPGAVAVEDGSVERVEEQEYITPEMLAGITEMVLVKKGRLSVQPVTPIVYEAIRLLGTLGGWEEWFKTIPKAAPVKRVKKVDDDDGVKQEGAEGEEGGQKKKVKLSGKKGKSKQVNSDGEEDQLMSDEEEVDVKPVPSPKKPKPTKKSSPVDSNRKKKGNTKFREDSEELQSEEEVIRTTAGGRAARKSARNA